jgi:hypothetical protein
MRSKAKDIFMARSYACPQEWRSLFGTYKDTDAFAAQCGFPRGNERHLADMLAFRDVYSR